MSGGGRPTDAGQASGGEIGFQGGVVIVSSVAAVASATLFAFTTNLQRAAASSVPSEGGGPFHLLRRLVADRRWLAGGVIGGVALGLHAVALARGSVMVVQSVMALGLVIALYVEAVRERRRLHPNEVVGAALVVAGVVAVVGGSRVADGASTAGGQVVAICAAVVLGTFLAVLRSRRAVSSRRGARLLAAAGGACLAVDAVFLQRVAASLDAGLASGFAPGFASPAAAADLAGFFAASMIGGVAVHRAYQVAPLRSVQPALAAAEPVTAFLISVTLLHDGVRAGTLGHLIVVGGLAAITSGIVVGLRSRRVDGPTAQPVLQPTSRPSWRPAAEWVGEPAAEWAGKPAGDIVPASDADVAAMAMTGRS
jgi:drug/metabolite transporter (DMT)-like permease